MIEGFELYVDTLISSIPHFVYEGLLSIFLVGALLLLFHNEKERWKDILLLFLIVYILYIYSSTLFCRDVVEERRMELMPFWSYAHPGLFEENVMNVLVFLPVGVLTGITIKGVKWWKVLLIGSCISISIELFQLLFQKGCCDVDDVIHNTLGCMIGYGLFSLIRCAVKSF